MAEADGLRGVAGSWVGTRPDAGTSAAATPDVRAVPEQPGQPTLSPAVTDGLSAGSAPKAPDAPPSKRPGTTAPSARELAQGPGVGLQSGPATDLLRRMPGGARGQTPIGTGALPAHPFAAFRLDAAFNAKELTEINRLARLNASATEADLDKLAKLVHARGPEHAGERAAALTNLLRWVETRELFDPAGKGPLDTWRTGTGVCVEQGAFTAYLLERGGIEAHLVTYFGADVAHSIPVYRNPTTGKWNVLEYSRAHVTEARTLGEAMAMVAPDALQIMAHDRQQNGTQVAAPTMVIETDAGLELRKHILGTNAARPGTLGGSEAWATQREGGVSTPLGERTSLEVTGRPHEQNPMLRGATSVVVRHELATGDQAHVGVTQLPGAFKRSVGPRQLESHPLTVLHLGVRATRDLAGIDLDAAGKVRFESAVGADVTAALVYNDKLGGFDKDASGALSDAGITLANRVSYQSSDDFAAWVGLTSNASGKLVTSYLLHDASPSGVPLTHVAQVGARASYGPLSGQATLSHTLQTATSLVPEGTRLALEGSYQVNPALSLAARASMPLGLGSGSLAARNLEVGARYALGNGDWTLSAAVGMREGDPVLRDETYGMVQLQTSFDGVAKAMGKLGRMLGAER